eukprot:7950997-Lingulodinium_polyedra.AAC.1
MMRFKLRVEVCPRNVKLKSVRPRICIAGLLQRTSTLPFQTFRQGRWVFGGRLLQSLDAADINSPLCALGIPDRSSPDRGRHVCPPRHCLDAVLVSVVSPRAHRIQTPMFGVASLPIGGHTGTR